jgi:transposase-like protein
MSKKHGNRYSKEFKQEAVRLLLTSGKNAKQLGRELGVTGQSLARLAGRGHPQWRPSRTG